MAETPTTQLWAGRAAFVCAATFIMFLQLLPIDSRPERWAFPDLLLIGTFLWVARRPDFAPVAIIATVFVLCDFLFQRPPGLLTALVVVATEVLRRRSPQLRNAPIIAEWASIAAAILAVTMANRLILAITMTPQAPLGMTLIQMIATIASYPLVLLAARFIFGLSRPAPGEVDSYGHRI